MRTLSKIFAAASALTLALVIFASPQLASATHAWGAYHWARSNNPFTLKLGDNLTSTWDPYLITTSNDWSVSSVLDTAIVTGQGRKNCRPTAGRAEICNAKYGNNGWLGIASIWVSGTHITQGTVKVNDTYFAAGKYNTPAWRNMVMCQEVGHVFGLDHQDEDFGNPNLGTCMDYASDPTTNQHPNAHDYEMLETIYAHVESSGGTSSKKSLKAAESDELDGPPQWGKVLKKSKDGKTSLYERDLGKGHKVFTFVFWTEEEEE